MYRNPLRGGLGLLELLVVVVILLLLMALLLPVYNRTSRTVTPQVPCMNNQRQIVLAVQMWAADHQDQLPAAGTVWRDLRLDRGTLVCPQALVKRRMDNTYGYSAVVAGKAPDAFAEPNKVLVTCDGQTTTPGGLPNVCCSVQDIAWRHGGKAIAGFLDTHVELISPPGDTTWFTPVMKPGESDGDGGR